MFFIGTNALLLALGTLISIGDVSVSIAIKQQ